MSFKKPFRAVPIREGQRYRKQRARKQQSQAARFLTGAALAGAVVGVGSIAISDGGPSAVAGTLKSAAVSTGVMRAQPLSSRLSNVEDSRQVGGPEAR